ncbi:MAG: hypothetical protein MK009_08910 [Gammaproteobacteria bacterium]|nr:hypothetical protein [Gammaproteobacteria bacterium]|tara:strand:- start:168 stop:389 length:222 start_codon:yes stop_codon:yes gene_type:complete
MKNIVLSIKEFLAKLFMKEKIKEEAKLIAEDVVDEIKHKVKVKEIKEKMKRARDAKGRFLKDDPSTEKNEAYE